MIINQTGGAEEAEKVYWASCSPTVLSGISLVRDTVFLNTEETPVSSWGYRYIAGDKTYGKGYSQQYGEPRFFASTDFSLVEPLNATKVNWSPSTEPKEVAKVTGDLSKYLLGTKTTRFSKNYGWSIVGNSMVTRLEAGSIYEFEGHIENGSFHSLGSNYSIEKSCLYYREDYDKSIIHGKLTIVSKSDTEITYSIEVTDYHPEVPIFLDTKADNSVVVLIATKLKRIN